MKWAKIVFVSMTLAAGSLQGALITVNFDNTGTEAEGVIGNTRTRTSGLFTVSATAWSNTGAGGTLEAAALGIYGGSGIAVCNSAEIAGDGCLPSGDPTEHQIDNSVQKDFVKFQFTKSGNAYNVGNVTVVIGTLASDWDVTFWLGNTNTVNFPNGLTFAQVTSALGAPTDIPNGSTSVELGVSRIGDTLFFGAQNGGDLNDGFKIKSVSFETNVSQVPEPSTYALIGVGLLGLGYRGRKSAIRA